MSRDAIEMGLYTQMRDILILRHSVVRAAHRAELRRRYSVLYTNAKSRLITVAVCAYFPELCDLLTTMSAKPFTKTDARTYDTMLRAAWHVLQMRPAPPLLHTAALARVLVVPPPPPTPTPRRRQPRLLRLSPIREETSPHAQHVRM